MALAFTLQAEISTTMLMRRMHMETQLSCIKKEKTMSFQMTSLQQSLRGMQTIC